MTKFMLLVTLLLTSIVSCATRKESVFSWVNQNNYTKLEQWLDRGGDPNLKDDKGCTLLYAATGPHGGNEVTTVLIKHGAKVNEGCGKYSPLMNAASWADYDRITILLAGGADPNLKNENGLTALHLIGKSGNGQNEVRVRIELQQAMNAGTVR